MRNDEITVGIKTFLRPKKLKKCLASLESKGFKEIIIVDNGAITEEKQKIYDNTKEKLPCKIFEVKFDSGVGYIQNKIIPEVKTQYLFIIDDDMEITNIEPLKQVLEENGEFGGVTGVLFEDEKIDIQAGNLHQRDKTLIQENKESLKNILYFTKSGIPYFIFDYIRYPLLLRKECIEDCGWDNKYKVIWEHLDFMWSHKKLGKWKFAITPSSITIHNPGGSKEYLSYRYGIKRQESDIKYFLNKFNLNKVIIENISLSNKISTSYYIEGHMANYLPPIFYKIYRLIRNFLTIFYIDYFQKRFKALYYVGKQKIIFFKS